MSHIPKSYHIDDLKPPQRLPLGYPKGTDISKPVLTWTIHPQFGGCYELVCDDELWFRDIVEVDGTLYMVGRTVHYALGWWKCWLIERDKLLDLIAQKYGEAPNRPKVYSIPNA